MTDGRSVHSHFKFFKGPSHPQRFSVGFFSDRHKQINPKHWKHFFSPVSGSKTAESDVIKKEKNVNAYVSVVTLYCFRNYPVNLSKLWLFDKKASSYRAFTFTSLTHAVALAQGRAVPLSSTGAEALSRAQTVKVAGSPTPQPGAAILQCAGDSPQQFYIQGGQLLLQGRGHFIWGGGQGSLCT